MNDILLRCLRTELNPGRPAGPSANITVICDLCEDLQAPRPPGCCPCLSWPVARVSCSESLHAYIPYPFNFMLCFWLFTFSSAASAGPGPQRPVTEGRAVTSAFCVLFHQRILKLTCFWSCFSSGPSLWSSILFFLMHSFYLLCICGSFFANNKE